MADEKLSIGIVAELGQFRREMSELGVIGEAEIRDMVNGIQRDLKRAEKAAQKVGHATAQIGDAAKGAQAAAKKAAELMGGAFTQVSGVVFELLPNLGAATGAMGAIGIAATGAGVAVVAALAAGSVAFAAVKGIADAGLAAEERLRAAGLAATIPPEAAESLSAYRSATQELRTSVDLLQVQVGSLVADELAGLTFSIQQLVEYLASPGGMNQAITVGTTAVRLFADQLGPVGTAVEQLAEDTLAWVDALGKSAAATDKQTDAIRKLIDEVELLDAARIKGEVEGLERAKVHYDEQIDVLDVLSGKYDQQQSKLREVGATNKIVTEQLAIDWKEYLADNRRNQEAGQKKIAESQRLARQKTGAEAALWWDRQTALAERSHAEQARMWTEAVGTTLDALGTLTAGVIASYEARVSAGERLTEAEKAAARRAYIAAKAIAITNIILQSAVAFMGFLANASATGPAAFGLAAAQVGAALAAVAAVIGEPIPVSFRKGSTEAVPDHVLTSSDAEGYNYGSDYMGGTKGTSQKPQLETMSQSARSARTGSYMVTVDPALRSLSITTDARVGKLPRRTGGL